MSPWSRFVVTVFLLRSVLAAFHRGFASLISGGEKKKKRHRRSHKVGDGNIQRGLVGVGVVVMVVVAEVVVVGGKGSHKHKGRTFLYQDSGAHDCWLYVPSGYRASTRRLVLPHAEKSVSVGERECVCVCVGGGGGGG